MKTIPYGVILCMLLSPALPCHARVYKASTAAEHAVEILQSAGGTLAYETSITLNQGRGRVSVVAFENDIQKVVFRLSGLFQGATVRYGGGSMALLTLTTENRVLRMVVLQPPGQSATIVFSVNQSAAEHAKSKTPPEGIPVDGVPLFPGASLTFLASQDNSRATVAVATAAAGSGDVRRFYRSHMAREGWIRVGTATSSASEVAVEGFLQRVSMAVFLKPRRVCCVFARSGSSAGSTSITVLHKEYGLK